MFTPVILHQNDGGTESMDDTGFTLPLSGFVYKYIKTDFQRLEFFHSIVGFCVYGGMV